MLSINDIEQADAKKIYEDFSEMVYKMYKTCESLLEEVYNEKIENISLPVDILKVAKYLKIDVRKSKINFGVFPDINGDLAQLRLEENGETWKKKILVEKYREAEEENLYSDLARFAIAREIGKYLVREDEYIEAMKEDEDCYTKHKINLTSIPFNKNLYLPSNLRDVSYEIYALFLLNPLPQFLEKFFLFWDNIPYNGSALLIDRWLNEYAIEAQISSVALASNFLYLRMAAYKYFKNNIEKNPEDKYYKLFINF